MERAAVEGVRSATAGVSFTSAVGRRGLEVEDKEEGFPSRAGVGTGLNTYLLDPGVPALADLLLWGFFKLLVLVSSLKKKCP